MAFHPHDIHFGNKARELRLMHDLSQSEMGKKMNMSFQQIQKYETGANRIAARRMAEMCNLFSVGPQYFFDGILQDRADDETASQQRMSALRWASRLEQLDEDKRDAIKQLIVVLTEE